MLWLWSSLILEVRVHVAKREYLKLGHDVGQHGYIWNKLRELDHLVIQLRTNASLELFVHPHHLNDIVNFSEDKQLYQVPSLALKIGHSIKKCALILKENDLESGQKQKSFSSCVTWSGENMCPPTRTDHCTKESAINLNVPPTNVVKISSFLLQGARGPQIRPAWKRLNEVTLCHLIMFNRRRQGKVFKMKL